LIQIFFAELRLIGKLISVVLMIPEHQRLAGIPLNASELDRLV
jgi:hypothetical protein